MNQIYLQQTIYPVMYFTSNAGSYTPISNVLQVFFCVKNFVFYQISMSDKQYAFNSIFYLQCGILYSNLKWTLVILFLSKCCFSSYLNVRQNKNECEFIPRSRECNYRPSITKHLTKYFYQVFSPSIFIKHFNLYSFARKFEK